MDLQNLSQDDAYLLARLSDVFRGAEEKCCAGMTGFLDERQQEMVRQLASQQRYGNFLLYGGYDGASRKMLGVFPEYTDISGDPEPLFNSLTAVTAHFRAEDMLTHRDFLGALMNLGIKRETLGDILVEADLAVLFMTVPVANLVLEELCKVGRVGIRCECGRPETLPVSEHFSEIKDTVSSMRLDCMVSLLAGCSREKSAQLIRQGLVALNYEPMDSAPHLVAEGDKLSIRGYGKYLVAEVGGQTKKGRQQLLCKKYL